MFALALVSVDADLPSGPPLTPPPPRRRPVSRPTLTVDPTHSTELVASTLTDTRTKPSPDNVDVGQRRFKIHHGRDHPETTVAVPAVLEARRHPDQHTQHAGG